MSNNFNRKYMHPTRRKLAEMVHSGEYETNLTVGYAPKPIMDTTIREIGERWVDEKGVEWEQRTGYKIKVNRLTDMMSELRNEISLKSNCKLRGSGCDLKGKPSPANKKLIRQTGYCSGCLAKLEHPIRVDGLYIAYENFKVMSNMIKEGTRMLEQMEQGYAEAKQVYEYVDADGHSQKWEMEQNVDELKAEMMNDITILKEELEVVKENRKKVYELLKDKNYVLVNDIIEE